MPDMTDRAVVRAVDKLGGQARAAAALGVTQQAVSRWCVRGYAPMDRAARIAALTGEEPEALLAPGTAQTLRTLHALQGAQ